MRKKIIRNLLQIVVGIFIIILLNQFLSLTSNKVAFAAYAGNYPSPTSANINQGYLYGETGSSGVPHHGVDFLASYGSNVYAIASGTVYKSEDLGNTSYGQYIAIKSEYELYPGVYFYHLYAHLSERYVTNGQYVTKGQLIGKSGSSGNSSGPHLHFEIRMRDYSYYAVRNPEGLLARSTSGGYGGLYGKVVNSSGGWARGIRISGASKPESGYGASYSYSLMQNGSPFPDETAYDINYYIARAYPGTVTLNFANKVYTSDSIPENNDKRHSTVTLP